MEILFRLGLPLHGFPVIREVKQVLERLGKEPAIVVLSLDRETVSLHEQAGNTGRITVARVTEAGLIGRESQHAFERLPCPARLPLRGHEQKIAARLQDADHLGEERFIILDVLEKVDGRHEIEGRIAEG